MQGASDAHQRAGILQRSGFTVWLIYQRDCCPQPAVATTTNTRTTATTRK
ncbi:unnamed protein product [Gongylonema pulchrum]|uniref:Transposase n=1 Tax=Gongylonema pulchrum TaxID=637853 RepID=A0A183D3V1_9BILA|nr:unnamed protein product [Gongylonema pulchrum]